jgi:serine protease Do
MALDTVAETKNDSEPVVEAGDVSQAIAAMIDKARLGVVEVRSRGRGAGAGIIWGHDGKIITNHHVVVGTGGNPHVVLADGRRFETKLVAENPAIDLALLRIEATDLPAIPVGDSSKLRVGELVFAVGHPWGQKGIITAGIVSGIGHVTGVHTRRTADYIRSDVALAPGNSGGPLLNAAGEVVGVNSMIFGGDLSVAVPAHVALEWLAQAGKRAYLGVGVRPVRVNNPRQENEITVGVLVIGVDPAGPAQRAGVQVGDIVLSVAEQPVVDTASLRKALTQGVSKGTAELAIIRGGKPATLEVSFEKAA